MKRILVASLALILTACAGVAAAPAASKSESPQASLKATGTAMRQLQTVRFNANATVDITLPQAVVDQLKSEAGSQGSFLSSSMTVTLTASGAVRKPNQLDATIKAQLGTGLTITTEVIATGGHVYYKDPMTGTWKTIKHGLSPKAGAAGEQAAPAGSASSGNLYQLLIDTGTVTEINDQPVILAGTDHYRVVANLARLFQAIMAQRALESPEPSESPANAQAVQALNTVLENSSLTFDAWTDSDHRIHQLTYDADVSVDLHDLAAAAPASKTPGNGSTPSPLQSLPAGSIVHVVAHAKIDLSHFNESVTITAPTVTG